MRGEIHRRAREAHPEPYAPLTMDWYNSQQMFSAMGKALCESIQRFSEPNRTVSVDGLPRKIGDTLRIRRSLRQR